MHPPLRSRSTGASNAPKQAQADRAPGDPARGSAQRGEAERSRGWFGRLQAAESGPARTGSRSQWNMREPLPSRRKLG